MALAQGVGSDVILLRVVPSPEPLPEGLVSPGAPTADHRNMVEQKEREEAEAYLQKIYSGLPTAHLFFDVAVTSGYVADAIVDYATAHNTDLIVMSSHGRSGVSRWLYGSVAEKVLRGADCATLIIRSPAARSCTRGLTRQPVRSRMLIVRRSPGALVNGSRFWAAR